MESPSQQKEPYDFKEAEPVAPTLKVAESQAAQSETVAESEAARSEAVAHTGTASEAVADSEIARCEPDELDPLLRDELMVCEALGTHLVCKDQGIFLLTEKTPSLIKWSEIHCLFAFGSELQINLLDGSITRIKTTDIGTGAQFRELIKTLDQHSGITHNLDPVFFEPEASVTIPFWPYTSDPEAQQQFKKESDRIIIIFFALFLVVCAMFTPLLGGLEHANGSWFYMFKCLPLLILASYAKTYSATRMVCDSYGITLDAVVAGNKWRKKLILWKRIRKIYLTPAKPGQRVLDRSICFQIDKSLPFKLKLEKIATGENWNNLMHAIDTWSSCPLNEEEHKLFATINLSEKDPTYTQLWLDALTAPIHRERLVPLQANASLHQGKYILDRKLGSGGQGSAYLAHDTAGNQVVLKEYILPVYVDARVRRRALESFEHEAAMLRNLNNPAIVKLLDVFVEDHRGYLVLEFIDGINLHEYVAGKGPVPESTAREWALSMARILAYLHHQSPPVVHRDFTPDNLILLPDGSIKLIDFMVALQETESATATVVGKHAYLPPEQFRGAAIAASDIYALGCTLHYLLTGADPEPLMSCHPILSPRNDTVGGAMDDFVAKCTCQELEGRYRTAEELIAELEKQRDSQQQEPPQVHSPQNAL